MRVKEKTFECEKTSEYFLVSNTTIYFYFYLDIMFRSTDHPYDAIFTQT